MKKSLCALWLLILLPFGLVQAAEFKLTGRTSWQLGQLMVNAIYARDYPVVQGVTLVFGFLVIMITLLTDIIYTMLDPRVSYD